MPQCSAVRIGHIIEDTGGAGQCQPRVVAIEESAFGMVVAVAGQKVAPAKVVGARHGMLLDRIRPEVIRRVFVLLAIGIHSREGNPVVTGWTLGPGGVAPRFEAMPHPLLRVPLGLNEQIAQPLLQKPVVMGAEQGRLPDFLRRRAEDVHDALSRTQVDRKVLLAVGKINQVFGKIAVFRSVSVGELVGESWAHISASRIARARDGDRSSSRPSSAAHRNRDR